jgi:hypothetical protein
MTTFDTTAPITAVVELAAGRVQLIAADRSTTTVEIRPVNPAKGRDVTAAEQTTLAFTDGVLHVTGAEPTNPLVGASGSVEITIQVPAGSHVQAAAAAAELRGVGRLGEVTFDGAYRQIKLDEAASLRLTAVDGDVEVGRLTGPAQLSTARGDIRIAEAHRGTVELTTQSGSITIGAAAGVSATLDAGTTHGRISNTLTNNDTTELDIHATTANGDITARSL